LTSVESKGTTNANDKKQGFYDLKRESAILSMQCNGIVTWERRHCITTLSKYKSQRRHHLPSSSTP